MKDSQRQLELIQIVFDKHQIKFSKAVAAKIVGGKYRLERLVENGEIRMEKPEAKQNGRWHCNGWDVITHTKL